MSSTPPVGYNHVRLSDDIRATEILPDASDVPYGFYTSLETLSRTIHSNFVSTDQFIKEYDNSLGGNSPFSLHFRRVIKRGITSTKILEQLCKHSNGIHDFNKVFINLLKRHCVEMEPVCFYAKSPIARGNDGWKIGVSVSAIVFEVEDTIKEIRTRDGESDIIQSFKLWFPSLSTVDDRYDGLACSGAGFKCDIELSNPPNPLPNLIDYFMDSACKLRKVYERQKEKFPQGISKKIVTDFRTYQMITDQLHGWFNVIKYKPQSDVLAARELHEIDIRTRLLNESIKADIKTLEMFLVYQAATEVGEPFNDTAADIITETIKLHQNSTADLITYFVGAITPIPINGVDNIPVINLSERSQRCLDSANAIKSTFDSRNFPKEVGRKFNSFVMNFVRSTKILNARLVNLLSTEVLDPEIGEEIKRIDLELEKLNDDMVFFNKILYSEALRQNEYRDLTAGKRANYTTINDAVARIKEGINSLQNPPPDISVPVNAFKKEIEKLENDRKRRFIDEDTESFFCEGIGFIALSLPSQARITRFAGLNAFAERQAERARLTSYFRTQTAKVIILRDLVNRLPRG